MIERATFRSAVSLGEQARAVISGDARRARHAARAFLEHDKEVVKKLYDFHRGEPDARILVSNRLRDELARTLSEDETQMHAARQPDPDVKAG